MEKILIKSLQRVVILGEKGRGVPVLLTEDMQISVQAFIDLRLEPDFPEENEYLFPALHAEDGHHRAHLVLRKMANACGASDPSSLTSTRLRKHVGTLMTLLNLRDHELDAVADFMGADFMGHDIRVHRQCYRLSSDTMQLDKVSKILLNMEL
ncbi:Hydroxylamine reductase [Frankliniella fusca]|uniref:Hydroxylamine reductase n=1 Tax=Frankliniella fusca TaxID=407009 RepID=A0AAE1HMM2_9NEOP|nr:Hydroxylamine reductase [Frankliniella fusca]